MASQTPFEADPETGSFDPDSAYVDGWQGITRLMDDGASWSGHERNCAYLNLGGRRFVDVSAAAGLDHIQDGRAVARFDWDGDGDQDLVLKSRNGQQLRLLENRMGVGEDFLALRLEGTSCNRDAIGARVELRVAGRVHMRELRCGEGYLAQSSRELLFGLPGDAPIDALVVHWPGGEAESFPDARRGQRLRLVQGSGETALLPPRAIAVTRDPQAKLPELPTSRRIVLRTPLPLPTQLARSLFGQAPPRARLLNLWATWCAPCVGELRSFAERSDELSYAGLDILPLCLDGLESPGTSDQLFVEKIAPHLVPEAPFASRDLGDEERRTFEVLLQHLIAKSGDTPVPASLLVDKNGMVEVLYLGPVEVDTLIEDAASYGMEPEKVPVRCSYPGRWFYGMPRDWRTLAAAFRTAGLEAHASYYTALYNMSRRRAQ